MKSETSNNTPSAFEIVSQFLAALSAQDTETKESLHAKDYVVDWVYGNAFENPPSSAEGSAAFFPAWFAGFDEIDYEVKRTITAEEVVVTEWVFTGMHTSPLGPPVFEARFGPTGRTIQFRGLTIYSAGHRVSKVRNQTIF